MSISLGAEIYFAEGAETLAANMLEARADIDRRTRLYKPAPRITRGRARAADAPNVGKTWPSWKRLSSQALTSTSVSDPLLDRLFAKLRRRFGAG